MVSTSAPPPTNGKVAASNGSHSHAEEAASFGFSTRAIHVGSEPSEDTGAVIPAISLSTTYKQHGVGGFKVSTSISAYNDFCEY